MRALTPDDVRELLPVEGPVEVVRPHWKNPMMPGSGLRMRFSCDVAELIGRYRDRLVAIANAAQFLMGSCPVSAHTSDAPRVALDHTRDPSDMVWHTDIVHRQGSATIVAGRSDVPTGVISKPILAKQWYQRPRPEGTYGLVTSTMITESSLVWSEAEGICRVSSDHISECLGHAFNAMHPIRSFEAEWERHEIRAMRRQFWEEVYQINQAMDVVWVGEAPDVPHDHTPVLINTVNMYHCKQPTPLHHLPRKGDKVRHEVKPSGDVHDAIARMCGTLTHNGSSSVDLDWIRSL